MLKRLFLSALMGLVLVFGGMTPASAADIWVFSGRPQHRECTGTDYYIVTESIRESDNGFRVDVKMVNQPMGALEAKLTVRFVYKGEWIVEGPLPKIPSGRVSEHAVLQKIFDGSQPYRN